MIIKPGEKIHVIIRRLFPQDIRRHFIGEVMDATESVVRAEGYAYLYDTNTNLFVRKNGCRFGFTQYFMLISV